ncbi:MAG: hypothetical protein LBK95_03855 [Bifidobacteriaceae bacterium]|jgi:hypothetical protein|nr:hypothetical protein [Bifidobacteriaceae bacterium]
MNGSIPPRRPPVTAADMDYGAARSRRLLIDAAKALSSFGDAVTVIGAHAVHVWAEEAWGPTQMESTRDADVLIDPAFVTGEPSLIDLMGQVGVEAALRDRPGVYGFVAEAVWDRHLKTLSTVDQPFASVSVHVAGPAGLLVAKAHKVHERLTQAKARPDRLKSKDSGDVALLMMASDPAEVAFVMETQAREHEEIAQTVTAAARWLVEMYGSGAAAPRRHAADSFAARLDRSEVYEAIDRWIASFVVATAPWATK